MINTWYAGFDTIGGFGGVCRTKRVDRILTWLTEIIGLGFRKMDRFERRYRTGMVGRMYTAGMVLTGYTGLTSLTRLRWQGWPLLKGVDRIGSNHRTDVF